jgi:hypothetical protein
MLESRVEAQLRASLIATAGGYLRNPVRKEGVTCAVCTTPVDGYRFCSRCNQHRVHQGRADLVAPLTYAVKSAQSGYVMGVYKARSPVEEHYRVVATLSLLALSRHVACAEVLAGMPITHWAAVPSLPAKPGEHPFHRIVKGSAPGAEVSLTAAANCPNPRAVDANHFTPHRRLPANSHVLVLDDTWTSGGHAQSAASTSPDTSPPSANTASTS